MQTLTGNDVKDNGQPDYSIFTKREEGVYSQEIDVTDEEEQVLYQSSSFLCLTDVTDPLGSMVAKIRRKMFTNPEKYILTMEDGRKFTFTNELSQKDEILIGNQELMWKLQGDVIKMKFSLFNENNKLVALIRQIELLDDRFRIDIYNREHEQVTVAIAITLQNMFYALKKKEETVTIYHDFN